MQGAHDHELTTHGGYVNFPTQKRRYLIARSMTVPSGHSLSRGQMGVGLASQTSFVAPLKPNICCRLQRGCLTTRLTTVPSGHSLIRGQMGVGLTVQASLIAQSEGPTVLGFCCTLRNHVKLRACSRRFHDHHMKLSHERKFCGTTKLTMLAWSTGRSGLPDTAEDASTFRPAASPWRR